MSIDTDLPTHLRLMVHPFTGLHLRDSDRMVFAHAADELERLTAEVEALRAEVQRLERQGE